jgi:hypothetical protein
MTPAQVAHIMSLVRSYGRAVSVNHPSAHRELAAVEAALRDAPQAEGWVMVPVEPTYEMMQAGGAVNRRPPPTTKAVHAGAIYRAMVNGRPRPTPSAPTAVEPRDETLCGHCDGSGTVLAVTGHLGPDDYEYEAQCEACWGTGSSDLQDAINALAYQPNSVTPGRQMVHRAEVLRIIAARKKGTT